MRYLLDTHTFIWFVSELERLPAAVRDIMEAPENEIVFSCASAWEMAIKVRLGHLQLPTEFDVFLPNQLASLGLAILPIELQHVLGVARLPLLHRDPFDRLLVCQAQTENIPIISSDPAISQYGVQVIW